MVIILLFSVNSIPSLHMGKGRLCKLVLWETGKPVSGIKVGLDIDGDGTVDITQVTGDNGQACFSGLSYGKYYIYVDIDGDGVWDTVAEEAILDSEQLIVRNVYDLLPEMWSFKPNQTKK